MRRDPDWSPAVYRELLRLAEGLLAGERDGHTLQPTALTHEVWLRLQRSRNAGELGHGAFLGLAAQSMRRILTEHARARGAQKRGGGARRTTLDGKGQELDGEAPVTGAADFVLDLEDALAELERIDPELARIVELRFHAGLSVEETARTLDLSERTVKRRWRFARAWLRQRMQEEP